MSVTPYDTRETMYIKLKILAVTIILAASCAQVPGAQSVVKEKVLRKKDLASVQSIPKIESVKDSDIIAAIIPSYDFEKNKAYVTSGEFPRVKNLNGDEAGANSNVEVSANPFPPGSILSVKRMKLSEGKEAVWIVTEIEPAAPEDIEYGFLSIISINVEGKIMVEASGSWENQYGVKKRLVPKSLKKMNVWFEAEGWSGTGGGGDERGYDIWVQEKNRLYNVGYFGIEGYSSEANVVRNFKAIAVWGGNKLKVEEEVNWVCYTGETISDEINESFTRVFDFADGKFVEINDDTEWLKCNEGKFEQK